MTRCPIPFDVEKGREAAGRLPTLPQDLRPLISGAAGSSTFLSGLISAEANWLAQALVSEPEVARDALFESLPSYEAPDLARDLRRAKGRVALLVALADLGGVWTLEEVTKTLTDFADLATDRALNAALAAEIRRNKIPGQTEEDIATGAGMAVIAMGKMGAFELNYSSDIDLICLFDETRFDASDYAEARSAFIRATRAMAKTLSERTKDGYVFRTDLRLRPDASVTPVAMSMDAAERYYESSGRTWERAAYIKARAAAGDIEAGRKFLATLHPFVWRRHLDFAAIQDAHDMRLRIREHKGLHKRPSHLGHDLKLGQGGIREIEFFTQTRQIIAGGRDPDLRHPRTVEGLTALAGKGWVDEADARELIDDYRALREAEHRVQMIADQQTQKLPANETEFERLACLSGRDPRDYAAELESMFARVSALTEKFFAPGGEAPEEAAAEPIAFSELAEETLSRWASYPALRSPRAVEIFARMRPALLERLRKTGRPDEAIDHFDGFLRGLPAGVQLFSLFEANPHLLDLVVDVVDTAPALGQYLARNAGVFDAVIGGDFFAKWPGLDALQNALSAELSGPDDYEVKLDRARIWQKEWQFRVGVHHLRGLITPAETGAQYSDVAEAVIAALWPVVVEDFARKHGLPPGRGAALIGMGSLGAGRINAQSDLDLIIIYDGAGADSSDGRRPLATRAYYARITQAMVTALSAPTAKGRLYEVDMRLRPSGRQGPVATALDSFKSYQAEEAWTWEHLALTRARPLAGSAEVCADVEDFRQALLGEPRSREATLKDVANMRSRLASAKPSAYALDAKAGPGRLQDIELFAEAAALLAGAPVRRVQDQLACARDVFDLDDGKAEALSSAYALLWKVQAAARLLSAGPVSIDTTASGSTAFLLRETGAPNLPALAEIIERHATVAAKIIDKHVGRPAETD
ncbi:MAG: bifunctional [glutamine synthetase] adenylyltransferase/[glutamine synthetase]-adenylyl-L-tyrosine phosphorylase [Paracoccaceae bacterium]|nr:bifunctional [glutamine synthetase] adenylyltransferase/[glutamine synthetase]-adenylyl-L-tyrosine phosphorylase [Paracoccaceae bacterium]